MNKHPESTGERQARIAEIRRQIAAGSYETPDKISAAVEKMLERFVSLPGDQAEGVEQGM